MPEFKRIFLILLVFWAVCSFSVTGCDKEKTGLKDESFAEYDELVSIRYEELRESFSELFDNRKVLKTVNNTSDLEVVETQANESEDLSAVNGEFDSSIATESVVDEFVVVSDADGSEDTVDAVPYINPVNDADENTDKTNLEAQHDGYNEFNSESSFDSTGKISDGLSETGSVSENNTDNRTNIDTITYVVNKNTKKFHYESCGSSSQIKEKNKGTGTDREALIADGYKPCKRCNP